MTKKNKIGFYVFYTEACCPRIKRFESDQARRNFIADFAIRHGDDHDDNWIDALVNGEVQIVAGAGRDSES